MDRRNFIAKNVAALFQDGDVVNLGVGIPTLASGYVPEGVEVLFHSENGVVGVNQVQGCPWDMSSRESMIAWLESCGGEKGSWRTVHRDLINASTEAVNLIPGSACFDSVMAFAIARGGRLSATVLGALEVDEQCNLANWKIPGKRLNGMGGAMDLASGARRVVIAMEHCAKDGSPKIVKRCSLPLTAVGCVDTIVTELCIIQCRPGSLTVTALAPGVSREEVQAKTEARLSFAEKLDVMAAED